MFGIGSIVGKLAGGLLDKVGLGSLTPFVKTAIDAFTGNWLGVAKDVFDMVSSFKGNGLDGASKQPPLGGFENPLNAFQGNNPLNGGKISELLKGLSSLFNGLKSLTGGGEGGGDDELGGLGKILNAFKTLGESFSNSQLFTNRLSISQFTNIQA
jgi:hypothetical protein